jgi:hypothetical protein
VALVLVLELDQVIVLALLQLIKVRKQVIYLPACVSNMQRTYPDV